MSDFTADEIRMLKSIVRGLLVDASHPASPPQVASSGSNGQELDDSQLDNAWANKEIKRDPPRYNGPSYVGKRYSDASAEWHVANAGLLEWKAQKGREEVPVRMNNKGKPWWESDIFESKICCAWARRNAARPPSAASAEPETFAAEDDIPFVSQATDRIGYAMPRTWERF